MTITFTLLNNQIVLIPLLQVLQLLVHITLTEVDTYGTHSLLSSIYYLGKVFGISQLYISMSSNILLSHTVKWRIGMSC